MAKPDTFFCFLFFFPENVAEQIIVDRLETAERDSYMWHTMALLRKKKKERKKHWLTVIIQTGSRSSHKDIFSGKIVSAYIRLITFLLWHQCSHICTCIEDISVSRTGWEVTSSIWSIQSMHCLQYVAKTGIKYHCVWNISHPCVSTVFRLWWCLVDGVRRGAQSLCSTHGQVQTEGLVSLCIVKILAWVSGDLGWGWTGKDRLWYRDYTPPLPI